ncbi:MAG TPA: glycosyltransferase [Actinomycetota bacterium]|nr:glycosyltransferase [Actinomycetota bacterium]
MNVVILVPRRDGFADRDANWDWCRPWWQWRHPDWPVVEGHHVTGLFNRSAAINRAAELAGGWDVAVIIDSDVIIAPDLVREAVRRAHDEQQMAVAFKTRYNLSARGTSQTKAETIYPEAFSMSEPRNHRMYVARTYENQHSAVIAVPRAVYDKVGGFDEGFCGWGLEDTAFAIACETVMGKPLVYLDGEAWHLHHNAAAEKHGSPPHARNVARCNLYRAMQTLGDVAGMQRLAREGRELERSRVDYAIPQILHRVVPEHTPEIAERWWGRFGELHPEWRLMTHRDPLDPQRFPITSPHWPKVANGAQLADLVRLEALLTWGGIYVDQDVEPFRPFDALLPLQAFAAWEDEKVVPNAIMGARPDHPAIRACLDQALRLYRRGTWEAGPGVTTKVLPGRNDVLLLPPGSLYDVHYNDPDRDSRMLAPAPPWSFARHHYWGSWLPKERQRVPAA